MDALSLQEAASAMNGILRHGKPGKVNTVVIDHRQVKPGDLFFAIRGENFDGHDFIDAAFAQGAAAVVSQKQIATMQPYIFVESTKRALLDLAKECRRRFAGVVVGVTGSVGKTTTKEMISLCLGAKWNTLKTRGNLNNAIGLPRTLCRLDGSYRAAVIEMGMSDKGEISALSQVARPTVGVITTIGTSHIERLGSRENILHAKLEILDGMAPGAPLVVNADNKYLSHLDAADYANPVDARRIITCGIENQDVACRAVNIKADASHTEFDILFRGAKTHLTLPTIGQHNVQNALLAFAVARSTGIPAEDAATALANYQSVGLRQKIQKVDGITVVMDCYNASPESMQASLTTLSQLPCEGRRIAVLGDMLELGSYAVQMHQKVGEMAKNAGIDMLFCCGAYAKETGRGAAGIKMLQIFQNKESMAEELRACLKPGDCVLFKASRGVQLETVIEDLWERKIV